MPVCLVIKPHGKSIDIAIVGSWQEILKNIKDTIDISYATTIINFNRLEQMMLLILHGFMMFLMASLQMSMETVIPVTFYCFFNICLWHSAFKS